MKSKVIVLAKTLPYNTQKSRNLHQTCGIVYLSFDFRILYYLLMRCMAQADGWWSAVTVCHAMFWL